MNTDSRVALSGERRARRPPGENRERLLTAGILEFGRHGYRGASTTAIAARAEVPQPHVYTNFRTKQELFLGCLTRAVVLLTESARESTGDSTTAVKTRPPLSTTSEGSRIDLPLTLAQVHEPGGQALAGFLLQAVSALGEEPLRDDLLPELTTLRGALGAEAFDALLIAGADSLFGAD